VSIIFGIGFTKHIIFVGAVFAVALGLAWAYALRVMREDIPHHEPNVGDE